MKLKAGEAYGAMEALKKLQGEKLPVKGKYWLARIQKKLEPEALAVEEQRNELIRKHGEELEGKIQVPGDKIADFVFDFNEVLAQEIEVDCPTVKLEMLGDGEIETDLVPLQAFIDG